jgi:hypothetical protein
MEENMKKGIGSDYEDPEKPEKFVLYEENALK